MSRDFILIFAGGLVSLVTTLVVLFVSDYIYRRDELLYRKSLPAPRLPFEPVMEMAVESEPVATEPEDGEITRVVRAHPDTAAASLLVKEEEPKVAVADSVQLEDAPVAPVDSKATPAAASLNDEKSEVVTIELDHSEDVQAASINPETVAALPVPNDGNSPIAPANSEEAKDAHETSADSEVTVLSLPKDDEPQFVTQPEVMSSVASDSDGKNAPLAPPESKSEVNSANSDKPKSNRKSSAKNTKSR